MALNVILLSENPASGSIMLSEGLVNILGVAVGVVKTADSEKNQSGFRLLGQLKGHPVFLINILHDSSYLYNNGRVPFGAGGR